MTAANSTLDPNQLHGSLVNFWGDALTIERTRDGLAIAMPQTGADGWQMVIEVVELLPGNVRISDGGRTLSGLAALGQNVEADAVSHHILEIACQSHLEREGGELLRWLPLPLDPEELHVFAEALSAISHLHVLHEPTVRTLDVADQTLRQVFTERGIEAQQGASLSGRTEKHVRVDYLVPLQSQVAFQILRRRGRLLPLMEQWGYRWQDIRKVSPTLMPVMLFDPAKQDIDDASRAIGEEVCSLFCAYDETERIHKVLEEANS